MRKLVVLCTACTALFVTTAVASADDYNVTASTTPASAGSTKKPVSTRLSFEVQTTVANRPATATSFKVTFAGLRVNSTAAPACKSTIADINRTHDIAPCAKAKIGGGYVKNLVGQADVDTDVSIPCNLNVELYNLGKGTIAVWLRGGQGVVVQGLDCPTDFAIALDGKVSNSRSGFSLSFTIPPTLQHPITGYNQGISAIQATIDRNNATVKGKRTGFLESVGGCKGGKRAVSLSLALEAGGSSTSAGSARCR